MSKEEDQILEVDGVEETNEDNVVISEPFNPNDIKIEIKNRTMHDLIDKLEHDEINLFTVYQRRPNLWDKGKKSRLIESILLGMPIPSFYFEETTGKEDKTTKIWQVVDGLQRVSTMQHFVLGHPINKPEAERDYLALKGLDFLKEFEGKKYSDLPRTLKRRIATFDIVVYIIKEGTPAAVKYNLFKRINTAGITLTPQEIRHALNQGIAAEYVEKLAKIDAFKKATGNSVRTERMQDRDLVNRFLAFYILNIKDYTSDLDAYLHQIMVNINTKYTTSKLNGIEDIFRKTMDTAYKIFGKDTFRKKRNPKDRRSPVNKALFDSISVNLAKLDDVQRTTLIQKEASFKEKLMKLSNEDPSFWKSISASTGQKSNVIYRFNAIASIIESILEE